MNQRVLLAIAMALAGCQTTTATTVRRAASPKPVAMASVSAPSPTPAHVASPPLHAAPSASPSPLPVLVRPTGNLVDVTGVMRVDASYAIRHGAHQIAGSDALLMDDAAALVGNNGAGIVSNNSGSIIANNGSSFISDSGSSVISNNGGTLIGKVKFMLDDVALPAPGTLMPVAGMAVGVVDLTTDKPVALGQDAAGHPVYAVYTGADGAFHVYLPPATTTRRFLAAPLTGGDARLTYSSLQGATDASVTVDERSLEVEHYMRRAIAHTCEVLLTVDTAGTNPGEEFDGVVPDAKTLEYDANWRTLVHALADAGIAGKSQATRDSLFARLADISLAAIDIDHAPIVPPPDVPYAGPTEPALPALADVLGQILDATARVMQREQAAGHDPSAYFAAQAYTATLAGITGQPAPRIEKPADFATFLADAMIELNDASNPTATAGIATVLTGDDFKLPLDQLTRLNAAGGGIELALDTALFAKDSPTLTACLAAIQAAAKSP